MSRHNYINPAFCQQSEFYPSTPGKFNQQTAPTSSSTNISIVNGNSRSSSDVGGINRLQRSVSTRSFHQSSAIKAVRKGSNALSNGGYAIRTLNQTPPRPGPKPSSANLNRSQTSSSGSGRYALVPVEELPANNKGRYAVVPGPTSEQATIPQYRYTKSQDDLDRYSHLESINDDPSSYNEHNDTFTSLPPRITAQDEQPRLKSAFSSDFGSKSFVLVDQKSNQRYAVVPTEEDEEIVDENHEIIQMHNGRAHRYAVIPTDDDEETCLSSPEIRTPQKQPPPPPPPNETTQQHSYAAIQDSPSRRPPLQTSTPQKNNQQGFSSQPGTPLKNPIATQKLHELLSTPPRKTPVQMQRQDSVRSIPRRYQSQQVLSSVNHQQRHYELAPQRLQYDAKQAYLEARTTAVIQPRVAKSLASEQIDELTDTSLSKWNNTNNTNQSSFQKVANATATIGAVSLMLIIGGTMNSGLSLYMISHMGRSHYLDIGIAAGFAAVGLGILGFKSRHCDWLPNRNYISGYILVTVFALLKCCGLLVLLAMQPLPGTPLHDVTTGVVLGLSSLILLLISLGVITSQWCKGPPPDNRVDVY